MKKIQLGGHKAGSKIKGYALVDDSDFGWLNQLNWYYSDQGYAVRNYRKKEGKKGRMTMQEVLIYRFSGMEIDHKDRNRLNNQKDNLRLATRQQNLCNRKGKVKSTSKYKGVSWNKLKKKWNVQICIQNIQKHLGCFDTEIEAAKAYNKAAIKHHKDFAYLNKGINH